MQVETVYDRYDELMSKVNSFNTVVTVHSTIRNDVQNSLETLNTTFKEKTEFLNDFKMAVDLLQRITDTRNKDVKEHLKVAINNGINAMLQRNEYTLSIEDDNRGESKVTYIDFISNFTGKPRKIGTAVSQSSSLMFILTILKIANSSKFIALDEYLGGASGKTASRLSDILVSIAKNDEFQLFIVNHAVEIANNPEVIVLYFDKKSDMEGLFLDHARTNAEALRRKELMDLANTTQ